MNYDFLTAEKEREKELLEAEMIPTKPTVLTFFDKLWELQWKMLFSSSSQQSETHAYASFPSDWLFLSRGIAYWIAPPRSNAQIHLVGNPLLWISASLNLFLHTGIVTFYLLRQRRAFYDISSGNTTISLSLTKYSNSN